VSAAGLVLEAASEEDAWALARLEERSFSHPWSVGDFLRAVRGAGTAVVLRDPRRASEAARGIRAYSVFQTVVEEMEIHNLVVHPDHRRQGLGRLTLGLVLGLGARRGAQEAHLEVRAGNAAALALYLSRGFALAGVRRDYYSRPREDALLLRRIGLREP
jgi:ribosomal-protein-alanine N-acetyltransferase